MSTRRTKAWQALATGFVLAGAGLLGCGGGSDDDGQDPSTFRMLGNMTAVIGAASQSASVPRSLWQRAADVIVRPAIAQSVCSTANLEVCLETTVADASRVQECSPVDPGSCAFDVELALFEGAQLFVRDVASGRTAPFGGEVDPLSNGCRLLLCNVDLDFDRQVASPAAVLNSCAEPNVPFDCGFALSRTPTPRRGGGGGGGTVPTPSTPTPTLTPIPSATPTPVPTNTPVPTATNTPQPTSTPEPTPSDTPAP